MTEVPVVATFRDELSRRVSSRVSFGSPRLGASCAVIFPASSCRLLASGSGEYGDLTRDAAAAPALMASRTCFGHLGFRRFGLGAGASAFDGVVDPTGSSSEEKLRVAVFSGTSSLGA